MIKVSVIIVTYNAENYIEGALESIINLKKTKNIELVIVDGLSKDRTLEICNKYRENIDILISEKDNGIYDAMNKGIDSCTGDFYIFIGADDCLLSIPFDKLENAYENNYMIVAGAVKISDKIFQSYYSKRIYVANTIHHQSMFYNRKLNVKFNTKYKVFADFDLNQKFYKMNLKIMFINDIISIFNENGISSDNKFDFEQIEIVRENFGVVFSELCRIYLKYQYLKKYINKILLLRS